MVLVNHDQCGQAISSGKSWQTLRTTLHQYQLKKPFKVTEKSISIKYNEIYVF